MVERLEKQMEKVKIPLSEKRAIEYRYNFIKKLNSMNIYNLGIIKKVYNTYNAR